LKSGLAPRPCYTIQKERDSKTFHVGLLRLRDKRKKKKEKKRCPHRQKGPRYHRRKEEQRTHHHFAKIKKMEKEDSSLVTAPEMNQTEP